MAINVRGSVQLGETKKPKVQSLDIKKYIQEKLSKPNSVIEVKPEPLIKLEPVKVETITEIKRTVPVKVNNSISLEGYHCIEDGELIKHYNKRSSYLADMIQLEETK